MRLAGVDEASVSSVSPKVRKLLLERQMPGWAEQVRQRGAENIKAEAEDLGISVDHAHAALALEQFVAASTEYERVEAYIDSMTTGESDESELRTVVDDENPVDELRSRLEHLDSRRSALSKQARDLLGEALSIPARFGPTEARATIGAVLGSAPEAQDFLRRLELQAEWMERIESDDGLMAMFLSSASIVAGTCIGFVRNRAVTQMEFDVCIVDEASRATLTEALVPMARAKRWILVGDTRQLPPTDEDLLRATELREELQVSEADVKETLFQRMVSGLPPHSQLMLDEQYRMIRPIGDLISSCFYEGQLRSSRGEGLSGYDTVFGAPVVWLDTTNLGDRRREQNAGTTVANRAEVDVMIDHLDALDSALELGMIAKDGEEPLDVLAISPYRTQVENLHRRLATKAYRHISATAISVDAVQGREADLAIFSITRSNSQGRLGFLGPEYWRRINVALSRARFGLTLIGDADFVRASQGALKNVLTYVEAHPLTCVIKAAKP